MSNGAITPNKQSAATARAALKRRRQRAKSTKRPGGTRVGVARARDISNRRTLPAATVQRVRSFFARHDTPAERAARKRDPNSPAAIAWDLWGGDPFRLQLHDANRNGDGMSRRNAPHNVWFLIEGIADDGPHAFVSSYREAMDNTDDREGRRLNQWLASQPIGTVADLGGGWTMTRVPPSAQYWEEGATGPARRNDSQSARVLQRHRWGHPYKPATVERAARKLARSRWGSPQMGLALGNPPRFQAGDSVLVPKFGSEGRRIVRMGMQRATVVGPYLQSPPGTKHYLVELADGKTQAVPARQLEATAATNPPVNAIPIGEKVALTEGRFPARAGIVVGYERNRRGDHVYLVQPFNSVTGKPMDVHPFYPGNVSAWVMRPRSAAELAFPQLPIPGARRNPGKRLTSGFTPRRRRR